MEQIKNILKERENYLQKLKQEKQNALAKVPEGSLRLCKHGNKTQYYHRNHPKDSNGVYIKDRDLELAKKLAQKDYDKRVLNCTEKELSAINKYLSSCPQTQAEHIYEELHVERQKIIIPIRETDEEYVRKWQEEKYQGKEFYDDTPELYTQRGERVRSKSELIIADILNQTGVPYRYEYPLYLNGMGWIYPDFTVLNVDERKELFWEHFGMMDEPTYAESAIKKIATYEQNGIYVGNKLILTFETRMVPINQKLVRKLIEHHLK